MSFRYGICAKYMKHVEEESSPTPLVQKKDTVRILRRWCKSHLRRFSKFLILLLIHAGMESPTIVMALTSKSSTEKPA